MRFESQSSIGHHWKNERVLSSIVYLLLVSVFFLWFRLRLVEIEYFLIPGGRSKGQPHRSPVGAIGYSHHHFPSVDGQVGVVERPIEFFFGDGLVARIMVGT